MKILISGTMVDFIASKTKKEFQPYSPFFLNHMLNSSTQSWLSQNKSNDAIISGTLNEEPTFNKLHHESFVVDIFEVGLLKDKNEPIIGVSLNGIVVITIQNGTNKVAYVEIKTRVAMYTIDLAESAIKQHGRIVWCLYDNDNFKDYVTSGNRGQVIH